MASRPPSAQGARLGRPLTAGRLVIVGGGEHAHVVADAALAAGWDVIGYTDRSATPSQAPLVGLAVGGVANPIPCLGTDAAAAAIFAADDNPPRFALGFGGSAAARRGAVAALGDPARWAVIVHPAATISQSAVIGDGAVVLAGAIIGTGAAIGTHAIINSAAVVEHDVLVGDHAQIAPAATVGGGTRIGADAFIGLGATIRDHVRIGAGAIVGMGAVVVADVAPRTTVTGVPARAHAADNRQVGDA